MSPKVPEDTKPSGLMNSLLGAAVGGSLIGAWLAPTARARLTILGLVFVMAALVVGFFLWRRRRQTKRSGQFGRSLLGFFDEMRKGRDPGEVARLDALKRKFEVLTRRLKEAGQDIYRIPWFLIIGPSGSGKSWALRGVKQLEPLEGDSEASAPSRTGKGGTFLMDWWNSPEAMVLDTAGGVVFPEEKALESPEWKALLELLQRSRPECPINGLLVVIPSDMLLLKESELPPGSLTLEAYAQAVRSQIRERLQRKLQLRFPVYFVITKSDKIPGFREFADEIEATRKPALKDQILGWSELGDLGDLTGGAARGEPKREGFDAAAVERHVREVAGQVRRHRNTMLVKYAGNACSRGGPDAGMLARRQVATLFGFASALDQMAPRLREFVGAVFQPDPLAPLPPFVRGIYFTSAMREGEVLDPLRARRLGTSLAKLALPGGPDRVTKAFFLGELFLQKIFPEGGLVMPLVAARKYLLSRRRALLWSGIGAACFLLATIGIGGARYLGQIRGPLKQWERVREEAKNPSKTNWFPVIEGSALGNLTLHSGNVSQHAKLAQDASEYSQRGLLPRLLGSGGLESQLGVAGRKLFERGVVRPLAGLGGEGLRTLSRPLQTAAASDARLEAELSRIEGGLQGWLEFQLCPTNPPTDSELEQSGGRFFDGLIGFLVSTPPPEEIGRLKSAFRATYGGTATRRQFWPDVTARAPAAELSSVLDAALGRLAELQRGELGRLKQQLDGVEEQALLLRRLLDSEATLIGSMGAGKVPNPTLERGRQEVEQDWLKLRDFLAERKAAVLTAVINNLTNQIAESANARRERFKAELRKVSGSTEATNNQVFIAPLQQALDRHLHGAQWSSALQDLASLAKTDLKQLERDEALALASVATSATGPGATPRPAIELRLEAYREMFGERRQFLRRYKTEPPLALPEVVQDEIQAGLGKVGQAVPHTAAFAQATWTDGLGRPHAYTNVLADFLACLWIEQAITNWSVDLADKLPPAELSATTRPAQALTAVTNAAYQLLALDQKVADIARGIRDYRDRLRPPAPSQLQDMTTQIEERRREVVEALKSRLNDDHPRRVIRFGADAGGAEPLDEQRVRRSYELVRQWHDAWGRASASAGHVLRRLDPVEPEFIPDTIEGMVLAFDKIFILPPATPERKLPADPPLVRYDLAFPERSKLEGDGADPNLVKEAMDVLGVFRQWKFGTRDLDRNWTIGTFQVNAGFAVKAQRDTQDPWVDVLPQQPWTVFNLIGGPETLELPGGQEWLAPLSFSEGGKRWRAWLLIKKATTRLGG